MKGGENSSAGNHSQESSRGRSASHCENRRELRSASCGRNGSGLRTHYLRLWSARSAWKAKSPRRSSDSGCVETAICTPRVCGLPRLRLPGQNAAPAYSHTARINSGRLPEALGIEKRSSIDRSWIFRAAFNAGKRTRVWPQALEAYAETEHPYRIEISGCSSAAADQDKTITFSGRAVRG